MIILSILGILGIGICIIFVVGFLYCYSVENPSNSDIKRMHHLGY